MKNAALKKSYMNFWPYLLISTAIVLFYNKIFMAQGAWVVADHAEQHFPWALHLARSIKQGILPFWTTQIHSGFPIMAEGQIGAFYLPNLLFYFLLPIKQGYAWNIGAHLLLSAFFMIRFLKSFDLDNRSVAFGTFVYMFGATLGGAYYNITSLKVLSWFPLCLMMMDSVIKSSKISWWKIFILGFVFSLQLLVGYLQFAVYAMLFTGIYALFRFFEFKEKNMSGFFRLGLTLGIATIIAAILSYPQLKLTAELAFLSNRGNPTEEFAYVGSYSPFALGCFFFPSLEGLFMSKMYLGILPLFFMILGFVNWKKHPKTPYVIIVISLLLALGRYSPLYVAIVKGLNFYSFRTPVKFIFFTGFFLSMVSAFGMNRFFLAEVSESARKSFKGYILLLSAAFVGSLSAYLIFSLFKQPLYDFGEVLMQKLVLGKPGHPHSWSHYQLKLEGYIEGARRILDPRSIVIYMPVFKMFLSVGAIFLFFKQKISQKVAYLLFFAIMIFDLNFTYNDIQGDYGSYKDYFKKSEIVKFLENNLEDSRYFTYAENPTETPLTAAKNMVYELETVNAYSPLIVKDYYDFLSFAGGVNDSSGYHPIDDNKFLERKLKVLGALGVKYVVSDRVLVSDDLPKVLKEGNWFIYENRLFLPKFRLISTSVLLKGNEDILDIIESAEFDLSRQVALFDEKIEYYGESSKPASMDIIEVSEDSEMTLSLNVSLTSKQILTAAYMNYPGWVVYVDGIEQQVLTVNGIMLGVPLNEGRRQVVFKYEPYK